MLLQIDNNFSQIQTEERLLKLANKICEDDISRCKKIGKYGL